jgi:hypothetical protein
VTTNAARYQEVSLNPQKLAGQCGKLKCCLNYELASYLDAQKDFPNTSIPLETEQGLVFHQKTDVFKRLMWYSSKKDMPSEIICLSVDQVTDIITRNRNGEKVKKLESVESSNIAPIIDYQYKNAVDEKILTRFEDRPSPKPQKKHHQNKHQQNKHRH